MVGKVLHHSHGNKHRRPDTDAEIMTVGIPSDPYVQGTSNSQWHLVGTWGLHADRVWGDYTGAGILVADLDDGFQITHPDIAPNYRTDLDYDFLSNDSDASAGTSDNHGTAVLGTIIGDDNGIGTVGVAFDAQGFGIRQGFGAQGSLEQTLAGFQYALDKHVDILNNSWGFTDAYSDDFGKTFLGTSFSEIGDVMRDMVDTGRNGLGINIVFSAGNSRTSGDNTNYHNFQNSPYVITVAAIDSSGHAAGFSTPGTSILVSAGGVSDLTTDRTGTAGYVSGDYGYVNGTSFAAPTVSGLIALMLQANPDLGWRDVQEILAYSAQKNDPTNIGWQYNDATNWNGGSLHYSSDFGFGAADAYTAVRLAETWNLHQTSANMTTFSTGTISPHLSIPATGTITSTINVTQDIDIEHILIDLDISHSHVGDLVVTLVSPDGTQSVLVNHPENGAFTAIYGVSGIQFQASTVADWGESSIGTWTLKVQDTVSGNTGTLNSWGLTFMGNAPSVDDTYVYTNDILNMTASELSTRTTLTDTNGGTDTLDLAAMAGDNYVYLFSERSAFITVNSSLTTNPVYIQIAPGTVIENVICGDGSDTICDSAASNRIYAGRGDDWVIAGVNGDSEIPVFDSNDYFDGGTGYDRIAYQNYDLSNFTFTFIDEHSVVASSAFTGNDTLVNFEEIGFLHNSLTFDALLDLVTNPALPITGTGADDTLVGTSRGDLMYGGVGNDTINGNDGSDTLYGEDGNDLLDGGIGTDSMYGGTGDDVYVVDSSGDIVFENPDEGTDLVRSSITYALTANVENLILTGTVAIDGTGNELNNTMTGNSGANILDGGAGADTLNGGAGSDTYFVDNVADVITEGLSSGTDLVKSSISYSLVLNVENLTLIGVDSIDGMGNTLANVLTGNAAANTLNGGAGADRMVGGAGDDIYIIDNAADVVVENLGEGDDLVRSSITYTLAVNIENLALTGTAIINGTGNALNNILTGNAAANALNGGLGADLMVGGIGNDTYFIDNAGDSIVENSNEGTDLVQSTISYTLAANVENLTLAGTALINGTGNDLGNVITGNAAVNSLEGGAGNDTLNGGVGADQMTGGEGNDLIIIDNIGDVVMESLGEGLDTVQSTVTYTLGANIENLTLTGAVAINGTGNELDNTIMGNAAANVIDGGAGNDTLNGGAGADRIIGGDGNDLIVIDNIGDVVLENANEGLDTVQSSITYALGANIENLTLIGTAIINGTGNELDNIINGNAAVNILSGELGNDTINGGTGADKMAGGAGDDIYILDNAADVVTELAGEGIDLVQSAVTHILAANVENLTLIGIATINGTGNTLNNTIIGNSAANILNGGAGIDTLAGGTGNDTYVVDNISDAVIENSSAGTDLVQSAVTYTLAANVENLTLTGIAAINGTGNELDNIITGNAAANIIDGGAGNDTLNGGAGADRMTGSTGNDVYFVDNIGDIVNEALDEGIDLVQASVSYMLAVNIENLTLTGTTAINGTGNELDNILTGNAAANTLDGGMGADNMTGGAGNDTYLVDNVGDTVIEALNGGTDTVKASVSWVLADNIENLMLLGIDDVNGSGNGATNILIGNAGANILSGGAGDDTLNGGAGADFLVGGMGNDTYVVDNVSDIISENSGEGTDLVQSAITYALAANLENLTLTGSAAINATGNELDNTIIGNSAANVLDGGTGADKMTGGAGNDTYVVDAIGDTITEISTGGVDLVLSGISYALGANLENLTLTGSDALSATGNSLINTIVGNSGDNNIAGGAGNDILYGSQGADTFIFAATTAGNGLDTIKDFSGSEGDRLDLSLLLSASHPAQDAINSFIHAISSGGNTTISVDVDGAANGSSFVNIALLQGVASVNVTDLLNNGNLIT